MHYQSYFYPYPPLQMNRPEQQYPPVDISIFVQSVSAFQNIANEAGTLLKRFADPQFANRLMTAAQAGNQTEVNRLITSIGISTPVAAQYTPSGILLTMHGQAQGSQCCTLTMYLRWGF